MRKSGALVSAATLAGAYCLAACLTGAAATSPDEGKASDAVAAVQRVAPTAVTDIASLAKGDANTAVHATGPGGSNSVSVPKDPARGVTLNTPQKAADVKIDLPFSGQATHAIASKKRGVVVYDNKNGSSTIPVAHGDGTVQISTVIANSHAPKRYDYTITVPKGQTLKLARDGSAYVAGADDVPTGLIAAPWAKDAHGNQVATHYEIKKNVLTQVVDFTAGVAFPVVADPSYYPPVTWIYSRAAVEDMWRVMNGLGNVCSIPGLPWPASVGCLSGASLKNAITQAHYQKKRIKGYYYQCKSGGYCSYSTYAVVA